MKKIILSAVCFLLLYGLNAQNLTAYKNEMGKYGFKDNAGRIIITARFDNAMAFENGLAYVQLNFKNGFISLRKTLLIHTFAHRQFILTEYKKINTSIIILLITKNKKDEINNYIIIIDTDNITFFTKK